MLELFIFILCVFGLTNITVYGRIFDKIRPNYTFFHCAMCQGFHISWILFIVFWWCGIELFPNPYIGWFLFGCLGSGTSHLLTSIFDDDGIKISKY